MEQTQKERLDFLLDKLTEESTDYRNLEVADNYDKKRMALRSLMNIRMPGAISKEILQVQDAFLK